MAGLYPPSWPDARLRLDRGTSSAIHVLALSSVLRTWTRGTSPGTTMRDHDSESRRRSGSQRRLHETAGLGKIHLSGVFRLQDADHLAHVLDAGRIGLGDGRANGRLDLVLRHLLGQIGRNDRDLLAFLCRELRASALVVELDRLLALLDHLLQQRKQFSVGQGRLALPARLDIGVLDG